MTEGLPLTLVRRAAEATRMAKRAADLEERGEAITSRALAEAAHISLNTACTRAPAARNRRTRDGGTVINFAIELIERF